MTATTSVALRELLGGIIDYAGLFPPAGLPMPAAVENYARYRESNDAWMLGAFVVPAARLTELAEAARPWASMDAPWPVSLLVATPAADALAKAERSIAGVPLRIVAVECRSTDLAADAAALPAQIDAFFELTAGPELAAALETLAAAGRFAKIRTGSVHAAEIPSSANVSAFVDACAERRVPFKATAGLHHPLRSEHALSYEAGAPRATMHGFLNVFLGALLRVTTDADRAALEVLIDCRSAASWSVAGEEIVVGDCRLQAESIAAGRRFARSFGSCSFEEPIDDLRRLGWL